MALEAYAKTLYAPLVFGDLSLVTIVITASGRDAARSSPDTTVGAGASGAYVCTMPQGQLAPILGFAGCVNAGTTTDGDRATISGLSSTGGTTTFTVTKNDSTNAAGAEEIHVQFWVARS